MLLRVRNGRQKIITFNNITTTLKQSNYTINMINTPQSNKYPENKYYKIINAVKFNKYSENNQIIL